VLVCLSVQRVCYFSGVGPRAFGSRVWAQPHQSGHSAAFRRSAFRPKLRWGRRRRRRRDYGSCSSIISAPPYVFVVVVARAARTSAFAQNPLRASFPGLPCRAPPSHAFTESHCAALASALVSRQPAQSRKTKDFRCLFGIWTCRFFILRSPTRN
jgi:hypothetical protein